MTDTPQQARVLRTSRVARKVRATFPAGTRVVATPGAGADPRPGAMHGVVARHVPGLNAQGGYLVVVWETGHTGRVSACSIRRDDA